ncbi:hypothetical protein D3C87_1088810 [compost metagenome]
MGIVVVRGAGEDLQVERTFALFELQLVDDGLSLQHPGAVVVEGDVVVEVFGVADQAIIGNDLDAFFLGLLEHIGHGRAIDRRDDQALDALDHHVFDLRQLGWRFVLGILQVSVITEFLQRIDDAAAV